MVGTAGSVLIRQVYLIQSVLYREVPLYVCAHLCLLCSYVFVAFDCVSGRNHFGLVESGGSHGKAKRLTGPKVKGELTPDSLQPLVERLSLELPEGCMLSVCGKVSSVVEELSEC